MIFNFEGVTIEGNIILLLLMIFSEVIGIVFLIYLIQVEKLYVVNLRR